MVQNPEYTKKIDELLMESRKNGFSITEVVAYIVRRYDIKPTVVNEMNRLHRRHNNQ